MISVDSLKYGGRGLGPVDLTIRAGEFLWLCGASGSGKSTLCELLCGNLAPTEGHIHLQSEVSVGYLAQDFENQLLGATIRQELEFSRRASGSAIEPSGVARILGHFENRLDADPRLLSAGEQQLLLLACLMIARFNILVLDETLSRLTLPEMELVCDALTELVSSGVGVVLVSHQLRVLSYVHRVVALEKGLLVFDGAATTVDSVLLERVQIWMGQSEPGVDLETARENSSTDSLAWRLHGQKVSLEKGGCTVMLGPSGSGKSRLLAAAAGLESYDGLDFPSALTFAYLRERAQCSLQKRTVEQELVVSHDFGSLGQGNWAETSIGASIPSEWLSKSPKRLSQGQARFLVLACLLLQKTDLLLLDEPFAGLDAELRGQVSRWLVEYLRDGGRLIMTSHDPDEVALWGNSVVVLRDLRIAWIGSNSDLDWENWSDFVRWPLALDPKFSCLLAR